MNPRFLVAPVELKDGRLIFPTVTEERPGEYKPAQSYVVYLDSSKAPKFSPHPAGGWISPPWEKLAELMNLGEEPDAEHIRCACHRQESEGEQLHSLEQYGHRADCPKVPQQAKVVAPISNGAMARNMPKLAPVPSGVTPQGGLSQPKITELMAHLEGTPDALQEGVKYAKIDGDINLGVVQKQLIDEYDFMVCRGCRNWRQTNGMGFCSGCSR